MTAAMPCRASTAAVARPLGPAPTTTASCSAGRPGPHEPVALAHSGLHEASVLARPGPPRPRGPAGSRRAPLIPVGPVGDASTSALAPALCLRTAVAWATPQDWVRSTVTPLNVFADGAIVETPLVQIP